MPPATSTVVSRRVSHAGMVGEGHVRASTNALSPRSSSALAARSANPTASGWPASGPNGNPGGARQRPHGDDGERKQRCTAQEGPRWRAKERDCPSGLEAREHAEADRVRPVFAPVLKDDRDVDERRQPRERCEQRDRALQAQLTQRRRIRDGAAIRMPVNGEVSHWQ